jgi:hypothetical protein
MQPVLNPLPTAPAAISAYLTSKQIDDDRIAEFTAQGFPPRMVVAFLTAAEKTYTVVSSRLPGGVGTDLIEAGYDLKGFQIKAKSCDWGPMAGFICQLPFLNKKGFENIAYNTTYIAEYLSALDRFTGRKRDIAAIVVNREAIVAQLSNAAISAAATLDELVAQAGAAGAAALALGNNNALGAFLATDRGQAVLAALGQAAVTLVYNNVLAADATGNTAQKALAQLRENSKRLVNQGIAEVVLAYRQQEREEARWSGENEIPDELQRIPFVELKRAYDLKGDALVAALNRSPGIRGAAATAAGEITGFANNAVALDGTVDLANSTIELEFLLVPDTSSNLWSIYYKQVSFRPSPTAGNYTPYPFGLRALNDPMLQSLKIESKAVTPAANESAESVAQRQSAADLAFIGYVNLIFNRDALLNPSRFTTIKRDTDIYYPVCGIMNPHPPYASYPLNQLNSYKNAVSGDFDLFAFWPHLDTGPRQLERLSETNLGQELKFAPHISNRLILDFIPGFQELSRALAGSPNRLQESAELGNINQLGGEIGTRLNSAAKAIYNTTTAANKAFHSDEGGRPGVMEMEFPIAVFFPGPITTKALDNHGIIATPQGARVGRTTCGGLIKSIEDFVQLIIDLNYGSSGEDNQYKIVLHSEWMMHLFYMALPPDQRAVFTAQAWFAPVFQQSTTGTALAPGDLAARQLAIVKRMGDFTKISTNYDEFYAATGAFDQAGFVGKLQLVLQNGVPNAQAFAAFAPLQQEFLRMAFQTDTAALTRRNAIAVVYDGI